MVCAQEMQAMVASKNESQAAMEAKYKERLKEMDLRIKDVGARERKYAQLERSQAKSQEACQKLQNDITAIKQQKVLCVYRHGFDLFTSHNKAC